MKRIGIAACLLFLIATGGFCVSEATCVGLYGDFGFGNVSYGGLGLTFRIHPIPIMWGLVYDFGDQGSIALSGDWWVINAHLTGALDYYLGVGLYVGTSFGSGGGINFGGRIPIGIQFYPIQKLEVFLEGAPVVSFIPRISIGGEFRLGLRVHF